MSRCIHTWTQSKFHCCPRQLLCLFPLEKMWKVGGSVCFSKRLQTEGQTWCFLTVLHWTMRCAQVTNEMWMATAKTTTTKITRDSKFILTVNEGQDSKDVSIEKWFIIHRKVLSSFSATVHSSSAEPGKLLSLVPARRHKVPWRSSSINPPDHCTTD